MITEPEMSEEPESGQPADILSDEDRPSLSGGAARSGGAAGRRPWVWALGGIVVASAIWAAVLQATDYGQPQAPDLHGLHLGGLACSSADFEPLTDAVSAGEYAADVRTIRRSIREGPALDHVACTLTSSVASGHGWATAYAVAVTVDLHKKTDPRAEFIDTYDPPVSSPVPEEAGGSVVWPAYDAVTTTCSGLGDLAYFTSGKAHQALSVLYGGAVISLTVDATNTWHGTGGPAPEADGAPRDALLVDTSALHPVLPGTMLHLLNVLSY